MRAPYPLNAAADFTCAACMVDSGLSLVLLTLLPPVLHAYFWLVCLPLMVDMMVARFDNAVILCSWRLYTKLGYKSRRVLANVSKVEGESLQRSGYGSYCTLTHAPTSDLANGVE